MSISNYLLIFFSFSFFLFFFLFNSLLHLFEIFFFQFYFPFVFILIEFSIKQTNENLLVKWILKPGAQANDVCMSPIARSSQSASPLSGGHHYHHPLHQYSSMGPASAASSAHMSAGGSISPSAAQLQSSASVLGSSSAAGPGNTGALGPRAKTIAQSVANTELKRSRSQGTRNKLQMMHTIHQSMMIMPATIATDHHDPERLINSSSINHIGLHHHHHHGISLGTGG